MRHSLADFVKYNKVVYTIYYYVGSLLVNALKLFVRSDRHVILFVSFGGKRYDDSPRNIYEAMLSDHRFNQYRLIWAFRSPERHRLPRGEKIRIDTPRYFLMLMKAGIWITNSSMTRGLYVRGTDTFSVNTWHGTPIKRIEHEAKTSGNFLSRKIIHDDVRLCQGTYERDIFLRVFPSSEKDYHLTGLPCNDALTIPSDEAWEKAVRERLGIPQGKKIILYAPTFRDDERDHDGRLVADLHVSPLKWEYFLGEEYVMLLRLHHEVASAFPLPPNHFIIDVSDVSSLSDLIQISDLLVSDYSSIFFDYAITGKPMLCYTYDYDHYEAMRGMYFDIREALEMKGRCDTEEQIIHEIQTLDYEKRRAITRQFREKYVEAYGSATQKVLEIILRH